MIESKQIIRIEGRIPSKKNSRINTKSGRSFPSKAYSKWHREATVQLLTRKVKRERIDSLKSITITFTFGDKRVADLTNKAESVMDLLVDYGFIKDDNWTVTGVVKLIPVYRKGIFRVDIEIERFKGE